MFGRRHARRMGIAAGPSGFVRMYFTVFGVGLLIGLVIAVVWIIAGLLHFHPLW